MGKKKDTPAAIAGLVRDENGFGALPAFKEFHIPIEGFGPGAVVNGNEVAVVELMHDKPNHQIAADWVGGNNNISAWSPTAPEGDGWFLARIAEHDEGPYAVWARPAAAKPLEGRAYAEEYLLGSLIKAATKHLKTLSVPWIDLKEGEQQRVLGQVHADCRAAVRDAIDIVAGNARLTFSAAVDQVVFKDGVKCVLSLAKGEWAHALADAEGSYVMIVIEERSKLLQEGDALNIDPDQKPLFDQATAGTAVDTEQDDKVAA
jgi:hypothetical protein